MKRDEEYLELAHAIADPLFRRAFLITRDWHTAEDLTQETLTRLYVNFNRVQAEGNPSGYAFTTLFNLVVDRNRRRSSHELPSDDLPDAKGRSTMVVSVTDSTWASSKARGAATCEAACVKADYAGGHVVNTNAVDPDRHSVYSVITFTRADGYVITVNQNTANPLGGSLVPTRTSVIATDAQVLKLVTDPAWDDVVKQLPKEDPFK